MLKDNPEGFIFTHSSLVKKKLTLLRYILKYLGLGWLLYRISYYLKAKSGILRYRMKPASWSQYSLANIFSQQVNVNSGNYEEFRSTSSARFFFTHTEMESYRELLSNWDDPGLSTRIADLKNGYLKLFSHLTLHTGLPPDWHKNYISNHVYNRNIHWSRISDFDGGDIKVAWELSRFTFVFDLVRAYWRTGDETLPELFWELVEDWREKNPPNTGVNWKCGQETTFRVMAWCWGLYGFFNSDHSTSDRIANLCSMIFFSGERIEKNLAYGLSQRNNHSISEAVGLWTIGLLFPEFRNAERWKRKGKRLIEKLTLELFNVEGAFTQNSANYHRLALHALLWAFRLGEMNGERFSEHVNERFRLAAEFLYNQQDEKTGCLPNYGANDGALILPLSGCDFRDYRPVFQSCYYYLDKVRVYGDGLWDEELLWLFGREALRVPVHSEQRVNCVAHQSGYFVFRGIDGFLFTRCGEHMYRPGQGDMLHVDIWWKGFNIAIDPGSYSYNAPPPWDKGLARTWYHNTVTVDDFDQMDSYGKFLSFPWVRGTVTTHHHKSERIMYFEGGHNAFHRLKDPVQYRRAIIQFDDEYWIVIDALRGKVPHTYRLHWLFPDFAYQWFKTDGMLILYPNGTEYQVHYGTLADGNTATLVTADELSPRGWWSPYYHLKQPALSLEVLTDAPGAVFYTVLGPEKMKVEKRENGLTISKKSREISINLDGDLQAGGNIAEIKEVRNLVRIP